VYVTVTGSETAPQFFAVVFFVHRGWVIPLAETSVFSFSGHFSILLRLPSIVSLEKF
jgi:hypothetical protein